MLFSDSMPLRADAARETKVSKSIRSAHAARYMHMRKSTKRISIVYLLESGPPESTGKLLSIGLADGLPSANNLSGTHQS